MVPMEAFIGVKPGLSHLHVFGSPDYIIVPMDKKKQDINKVILPYLVCIVSLSTRR